MPDLPPDHPERIARARLALEGLATGDAFGERFFTHPDTVARRLAARELPPAPWAWTDDTAMALSVVEVLDRHGRIDRDALAEAFARRYAAEPVRGYGAGAHRLLQEIGAGASWADAAPALFGGSGSFGNGGAMRVAPVGAYFADDPERAAAEAVRSAEPTHAHPEGQAGAAAVAVATALLWQRRDDPPGGRDLIAGVLERLPDGDADGLLASPLEPELAAGATRAGLERALELGEAEALAAARALGNGSRISAQDTVPFCVWVLAHRAASWEEALWETVSALGDRDTTCAIVGGALAPARGRDAIPAEWRARREPLPAGP